MQHMHVMLAVSSPSFPKVHLCSTGTHPNRKSMFSAAADRSASSPCQSDDAVQLQHHGRCPAGGPGWQPPLLPAPLTRRAAGCDWCGPSVVSSTLQPAAAARPGMHWQPAVEHGCWLLPPPVPFPHLASPPGTGLPLAGHPPAWQVPLQSEQRLASLPPQPQLALPPHATPAPLQPVLQLAWLPHGAVLQRQAWQQPPAAGAAQPPSWPPTHPPLLSAAAERGQQEPLLPGLPAAEQGQGAAA